MIIQINKDKKQYIVSKSYICKNNEAVVKIIATFDTLDKASIFLNKYIKHFDNNQDYDLIKIKQNISKYQVVFIETIYNRKYCIIPVKDKIEREIIERLDIHYSFVKVIEKDISPVKLYY